MSRLKNLLYSYIYNPTLDNRLDLAEEYFAQQQFAAALTYYLKIAEVSKDKNLQYYCLLRCAKCVEIPGNRKHSVITLYKHAISLLPKRPEAYYLLSKAYEMYNDWFDAYLFADLGLEKQFVDDEFSKKLQYPSNYGLLFQKAVSSWHIGRGAESRELFHYLKNNFYNEMDIVYKTGIQTNIIRLGSGEPFVYYTNDKYHQLKFKFNGDNTIDKSYSQMMQDMFILSILNGKKNGTYLEIGSADPYHGSNTYLLETGFNWSGIGLDIKQDLVDKYNNDRINKTILQDGITADYNKILGELTPGNNVVDYLQLDAEPASTTFQILLKIPFDNYKFRVITYEHDYYADITQSYRDLSREYLQKLGYKLIVNDICADKEKRCSFEDWWVHPELIDSGTLSIMLNNDTSTNKYVTEYMYRIKYGG